MTATRLPIWRLRVCSSDLMGPMFGWVRSGQPDLEGLLDRCDDRPLDRWNG